MNARATRNKKDLLGSRWAIWFLWIGPWVLILGTGESGTVTHTAAWTVGFTVGGAACLINARRCGRRHCFYTGPAYLLGALASLLYGLGFLPLGPHGWDWILGTTAAVTLVACCGLEQLLGKYTHSAARLP